LSSPRSKPAITAAKAIKTKPGDGGTQSILEYSYLLLFFALVPLMFSLLGKGDAPAEMAERIQRTIQSAPPEDQPKIASVLSGESMTMDDIINALPGGKLDGAHLSRTTSAHWVYAAIAAVAYLLLLGLCFSVERAKPWHLLGIGAFTATVGIALLLFVQICANFRIGGIRGRGIGLIIFVILAFIGWSYASANDPGSNFLVSALGFTFGVGFCEEFTKAIPLFFAFRRHSDFGWRTACLWGLASGIGFGVAEGVMYSSQHYNGVSGIDIYLVRFVS